MIEKKNNKEKKNLNLRVKIGGVELYMRGGYSNELSHLMKVLDSECNEIRFAGFARCGLAQGRLILVCSESVSSE